MTEAQLAVGSTHDLDPRVTALVEWVQSPREKLGDRAEAALAALEDSPPREWTAPQLALAANAAYARVPTVGPRDLQAGHRIVGLLGRLGEPGARELVRVRERAYYAYAQARISKVLAELERQLGTPLGELEDAFEGPVLGADLTMSIPVGPCVARIGVGAELRRVETRWIGSRGKPVGQRPTVALRYPQELELVIAERRRLQAHLTDLRSRLERAMIDGRSWSLEQWTERMFGDPLRAALAERLIWRIEDTGALVLRSKGCLRDGGGDPISPPPSSNIRLWHPVESTVAERARWRDQLEELGVDQPIDQASREVTLADPDSPTLSFAAGRRLPQRPFRGFLTNRGWRIPYLGQWFEIPEATLELLAGGPSAVLHLEVAEDDAADDIIVRELAFRSAHDQDLDARLLPPAMVSEAARDVLGAAASCASGARPAPG